MNRKNIAITIGATGLVIAGFFAGSILMKDGSSTRVISAGGITPVAPTATPGANDAEDQPVLINEDGTAIEQSQANDGEQPQGNDQQPQPQGNGGGQPQQPQPQPEPEAPQPEPELPQPEPEAPQPEPEPEPEPEGPMVLVALPSLKQSAPADGATGIAQASNIVLTFSKEMDKASVQAAFQTVPAIAGAFSWDAAGKVMTFNPNANLAYGADIQWSVAKTAKDAAGYNLHKAYDGEFKVIRRSTTTLYSQAGADGTVYAPPVQVLGPKAIADGISFKVGSWQRGFVSFDLSSLPENITSIEGAFFSIHQSSHTPGAYVSTGNLVIKSLSYGFLDAGDWGKAAHQFCLGPCVDMQVTLSTNALDGWKTADLLGMVNLDWANRESRGHLSQFRLQFATENNGAGPDHSATFGSGGAASKPSLKITYLHP